MCNRSTGGRTRASEDANGGTRAGDRPPELHLGSSRRRPAPAPGHDRGPPRHRKVEAAARILRPCKRPRRRRGPGSVPTVWRSHGLWSLHATDPHHGGNLRDRFEGSGPRQAGRHDRETGSGRRGRRDDLPSLDSYGTERGRAVSAAGLPFLRGASLPRNCCLHAAAAGRA